MAFPQTIETTMTPLLLSLFSPCSPVAQFQGPDDEEDFDDERVEVLEDRGWMRGGASAASGGTGGSEEEQSLGPLDRARLQQA